MFNAEFDFEAIEMKAGRPVVRDHAISRIGCKPIDDILGFQFPVLDHGFVRVIDYMGDDTAVCQMARTSYGAGTKSISDDVSLIRYLLRHEHTSPFEGCEIKLHVKVPIFVFRQWIRHRTANVNEYSARYSILSREFHIPYVEHLARQSTDNKQGRAGEYDLDTAEQIRGLILDACMNSFDVYDTLIKPESECGEFGLARETGREVLPLNTYTEAYWKIDLHNLLHFLRLRMHPHAQLEIRLFAEMIWEIVKVWVPFTANAARDYSFEAVKFSRQEMEALRAYVAGDTEDAVDYFSRYPHVSKREIEEFANKLRG